MSSITCINSIADFFTQLSVKEKIILVKINMTVASCYEVCSLHKKNILQLSTCIALENDFEAEDRDMN